MRASMLLLVALVIACGEKKAESPSAATEEAPVLPRVEAYRVPEDLEQIRMDGNGSDIAWRRAREQKITLAGSDGPTEVTVKAIYHDQAFYLLLMWPDGTADMNTFCVYENPGRWKVYEGEDAAMVLFAPGEADADFRKSGFDLFVKDGAFFNSAKTGFADAWYWGCQTTALQRQARDHWLRANQSLRGDSQPSESDNVVNWSADYEGPAAVVARPGTKPIPWLAPKDSIALTKKRMAGMRPESNFGWKIPAVLSRRMLGSRGDVVAAARHAGGGWVLELARKLDTGHRDDLVQGNPLHPSLFAIAIWNGKAKGIRPGEYGLACTRSGAIELHFVSES